MLTLAHIYIELDSNSHLSSVHFDTVPLPHGLFFVCMSVNNAHYIFLDYFSIVSLTLLKRNRNVDTSTLVVCRHATRTVLYHYNYSIFGTCLNHFAFITGFLLFNVRQRGLMSLLLQLEF